MLDRDWEKYFDEKVKFEHKDDFTVVVPEEMKDNTPSLFCSVCDVVMSTADDVRSSELYCCCYKCYLKWVQCDVKKWESGWRPSQEEVNEELSVRRIIPLSLNLNVFET